MKVICQSLRELVIVAKFFDEDLNLSNNTFNFPYVFDSKIPDIEDEPISFETFEKFYLRLKE